MIGGSAPTKSEVAMALLPASVYAQSRDVPDVLGLADYREARLATAGLVQDRFRAGDLGARKSTFPLLKADPTKTRLLTVLDPIDDLALRVFVGRCSPAIAKATDESYTLNGVIRRAGPGWFTANYKEQARERRRLQKRYLEAWDTRAVAFFDVRNFFPSCSHELLERLLIDVGAPAGAVAAIFASLARSYSRSGRGLPIGFEGSGPIANLMLRPMDEAIKSSGRPFVRWTDDVEVFVRGIHEWVMVAEAADLAVRSVGLDLNLEKSMALPVGGPAEAHLSDPTRDSIFASDDPVATIVEELAWDTWLAGLGATGDMPPGRFRNFLGKLRAERDPGALDFLVTYPFWICREPRAVAEYLITLSGHGPTKSLVDRDWVMERAADPAVDDRTAAGQLHMMRVMSSFAPTKDQGDKLVDFGTDYRRMSAYPELCAWSLRAWSSSRGWNASDALNIAEAFGPTCVQRAAMGGFLAKPPGRRNRRGLMDRAAADPELRPTVEAVLAK